VQRPTLRLPLSAIAVVAVIAMAIVLPTAFGASAPTPAPVRKALAQSDHVQGAPGRTMVLSKVTVPPGAKLAVHHHLGTQISRVDSGTLTYTVRRGEAELFEGESEEGKLVRTIEAGQTAKIHSGQWLVEQPSDIHQAANRGSSPVVIYLATLFKDGAPPSTPVVLGAGGDGAPPARGDSGAAPAPRAR
jgi:quercetin dioxygenase-like cupin family protein